MTGAVRSSLPSWMSWSAAIDVNSFETDAMSKIVSSRIGTCCSGGSSVPLASAYRTALPTVYRSTTTPSCASTPTAPGKNARPHGPAFRRSAMYCSAARIGAGFRPTSSGSPVRSVVHGGAKPCCGRSKRPASWWPVMALAPEVMVVSATRTPVAATRIFLARMTPPPQR